MPSPSRLVRVLGNRRVPLRTRLGLLSAEARRRIRPRPLYPVGYGRGTVFLSHDDYGVDWESLKFVVVDEAYHCDYNGAVVLDIGAHKGYYGAYALRHGARRVISFEPERENVAVLERSAAAYRARGLDWRVRASAVGAEPGNAPLHVMGASWGHALQPPAEFAEYEVGVQQVRVEAMADVLAEVTTIAGSARVVVKVNTEGAECEIVLRTTVEAWAAASELFVEVHPWARCTAAELAAHVSAAGFSEIPSRIAPVLRLRRREPPRSDPRIAPT